MSSRPRAFVTVPGLIALIGTTAVIATPASAQDFLTPAPASPPWESAALLESGLPSPRSAPAVTAVFTRWHGLEVLTTRALVASAGWRGWQAALGLAQTGDPEVGWTALGLGMGASGAEGGAGLRAVARRDRTSPFGFDARGAAVGVEVGGGVWVEPAARFRVWASAAQLWKRGEGPPLARPLEVGGAMDLGGIDVWFTRAVVAGFPRGSRGEHGVGAVTGLGPCRVWVGAHDQPLRGGLGVEIATRGLEVAVEVQSHPVLGETSRAALVLGGGR